MLSQYGELGLCCVLFWKYSVNGLCHRGKDLRCHALFGGFGGCSCLCSTLRCTQESFGSLPLAAFRPKDNATSTSLLGHVTR